MSKDLHELVSELEADGYRIHSAARFLDSPMMVARLEEALRKGIAQSDSPFVDRAAGAARWYCSASEVDRAATDGILRKHVRGNTPLFEKAEGDAAIRTGKWKPAATKITKKVANDA